MKSISYLLLLLFIHLLSFCVCQQTIKVNLGAFNDGDQTTLKALQIGLETLNTLERFQPLAKKNTFFSYSMNITTLPATIPESVELAKQMLQNNNTVGLLGALYSRHTEQVSIQVANVYKKPLVCFSSTASVLGDNSVHFYFTRTIPSDSLQAFAMIDFMYVFEFQSIGALVSNDLYGIGGKNELELQIGNKDLKLIHSEVFMIGNTTSISESIKALKAKGVKTVACFSVEFSDILTILQEAKAQGMYSSGYVWIFSETFEDPLGLKGDQITALNQPTLDLIQGAIFMSPDPGTFTRRKYFLEQWTKNGGQLPIPTFAMFAYDAVMLYGNTIANVVKKGGNIFNGTHIADEFSLSDFLGVSGRVKFDKDNDRIGTAFTIFNVDGAAVNDAGFWDNEKGYMVDDIDLLLPGGVRYVPPTPEGLRLEVTDGGPNRWTPIPDYGQPPPNRDSHGLAVHDEKELLIVFGGYASDFKKVVNDIWFFSFRTALWNRIYPMSAEVPAPRQEFCSWVYKDYYYVFGGYNLKIYMNDVWRFSLQTYQWEKLPSSFNMPSSRRAARAVVNDTKVYLYGGEDQERLQDDIWMYDVPSNVWTEVVIDESSITGPSRTDVCLVFTDNSLVLFGGDSGETNHNDLWRFSFDTLQWTILDHQNPPTERYDTVCALNYGTLIVAFGANDGLGKSFDDINGLKLNFSAPLVWKVVRSSIPEHDARDAVYAAPFDNQIYWFGGSGTGAGFSDFWNYDFVEDIVERIHEDIFAPTERAQMSASAIGNQMLVFGGIDETGTALNTIEVFNMDDDVWSVLVPNGQLIPARYRHLAVPIGDRIYVFYGQADAKTYLQDVWVYSYSFNEWTEIHVEGDKPSPRAGMTGQNFANDSRIAIYGGSNAESAFDEVWIFDLEQNQFYKFEHTGDSPYPYANNMDSDMVDDDLYIYGGADAADDSGHYFYILDFETGTWSKKDFPYVVDDLSRTTISAITNDTVLIFGGSDMGILFNSLRRVKYDDTNMLESEEVDLSTSLNLPGKRDSHVGVYRGNEYFVFGGFGPVRGPRAYRSESIVYSDVWVFRLGPVCGENVTESDGSCIVCGAGTYKLKQSCTSCPKGYYNADFDVECDPCPAGFYSNIVGADTVLMCMPCNNGYYNNKPGQAECKPCPSNKYCPIGTEEPMDPPTVSPVKIPHPTTEQPITIQGKDFRNKLLTLITFGSAIGAMAIMFVILYFIRVWKEVIFIKLDFLYSTKHQPSQGYMIKKKTPCGGIFSLLVFVLFIAFAITILVPAFDDNDRESRSLIPNLGIVAYPIFSDIRIRIALVGYGSDCAIGKTELCASKIEIDTESIIKNGTESLTCKKVVETALRSLTADACEITYTCTNCYMSSNVGTIQLMAKEPGTYAYEIKYKVSTSAAYPNQFSSVEGVVRSDENKFFRGVNNPTTVSLEAIQTTYTILADNRTFTGFHIDYLNAVAGDEVDNRLFNYKNGVAFQVTFQRSSSSLEVELYQVLSWPNLILTIVGGLSGVIGAMGSAMSFAENVESKAIGMIAKIKAKRKNQKVEPKKDDEYRMEDKAEPGQEMDTKKPALHDVEDPTPPSADQQPQ